MRSSPYVAVVVFVGGVVLVRWEILAAAAKPTERTSKEEKEMLGTHPNEVRCAWLPLPLAASSALRSLPNWQVSRTDRNQLCKRTKNEHIKHIYKSITCRQSRL